MHVNELFVGKNSVRVRIRGKLICPLQEKKSAKGKTNIVKPILIKNASKNVIYPY
jgi:hypothetical protein